MATLMLPDHFPCWVRAIYSWGGETKRDLGFIEGDLIECLNAGDGSWWMGRLKRDKRMVGLFPCNFVQVLDAPPISATASQNSSSVSTPNGGVAFSRAPSTVSSGPSTPSPQKKTMFRKPFSGYGSVSAASSPAVSMADAPKQRPYSSMKSRQDIRPKTDSKSSRPPSPTIPSPIARASPLPYGHTGEVSRSASPMPCGNIGRISRSPSPNPYESIGHISRASSPMPQFATVSDTNEGSSPPPPPPIHRVPYQTANSHSQHGQAHSNGFQTPRSQSPAQPSGFTPSPLRDAMNDVMTSLDDMSVGREQNISKEPETPPNIWSPEAFDEIYLASRNNLKSQASQSYHNQPNEPRGEDCTTNERTPGVTLQDQPQLSSYVERMENRLSSLKSKDITHDYFSNCNNSPYGPTPPPKNSPFFKRPISASQNEIRPQSAYGDSPRPSDSRLNNHTDSVRAETRRLLSHRKSAYELGRPRLQRTFTNQTSVTSASSTAQSSSTTNSNSTQLTSQSLMSGHSAGGFSATSAGSLARRKDSDTDTRPKSSAGDAMQPDRSFSRLSYHSNSRPGMGGRTESDGTMPSDSGGLLGGFSSPKPKKTGFFKKMLDTAKTSAATARSNFAAASTNRPPSRARPSSRLGGAISSISAASSPANGFGRNVGGGPSNGNGTIDWVQMRRDVNRANSLSHNERVERAERCEMNDIPVIYPDRTFYESTEGDESADGYTVTSPTDFATASNLSLVDKSSRFVRDLPVTINPISLAQGYLCRQYRSDVQKLRGIFTWVSERIAVEDNVETEVEVDTRRVLQTRRGNSEEIATLVYEMCTAIGMQSEMVRGYLKRPGQRFSRQDLAELATRPNHAWTTVVCDGEWRIMDCALASPTNPNRAAYATRAGRDKAEDWWFLTRPVEACWTHVPSHPEHMHLRPAVTHETLMALPIACPAFFRHRVSLWDFDTSLIHLDGLEASHVQLTVPDDVELYAEVEARSFRQDMDGDYFESGEMIKKRALAQAEFIPDGNDVDSITPIKRYTIKALLPPSDSQGTLKIYAGGKGLMLSYNSNPHQLALTLPLSQQGFNPDFEFFIRHPTPHALRNELYVVSPLCKQLAVNNTFVFQVRQHAGWVTTESTSREMMRAGSNASSGRPGSAFSIARPGSAMSMASVSMAGSGASSSSQEGQKHKPAKLAVQSPSGKILKMSRKTEGSDGNRGSDGVDRLGSSWETIIKIGERGVWRALVLADRSARWCVFGEWECV